MSTHAELAIQDQDGDWTHIYVHYDGQPEWILPALQLVDPSDLLAAREIRTLNVRTLEPFENPREPEIKPEPKAGAGISHLYTLMATGWIHTKA